MSSGFSPLQLFLPPQVVLFSGPLVAHFWLVGLLSLLLHRLSCARVWPFASCPSHCMRGFTVSSNSTKLKDHFKSQGSKSQATVKCLNVHVFIAFIYLLTAREHKCAAQRTFCRTQLSSFSCGALELNSGFQAW